MLSFAVDARTCEGNGLTLGLGSKLGCFVNCGKDQDHDHTKAYKADGYVDGRAPWLRGVVVLLHLL